MNSVVQKGLPKQHKQVVVQSTLKKDMFDSLSNMKQYQKEAFLFKTSFGGGRIVLDGITSQFGYTFVVPGFVALCMLGK